MIDIKRALKNHGYVLPLAPPPAGNYLPTISVGHLMFISGQLPIKYGEIVYSGKLGEKLTTADGKAAAELCTLNLLSQLANSPHPLKQVIKLEGYINCSDTFTEHAEVLNGASDLLSKILSGKAGHIRTAIGCSSLPLDAAVEIAAIIEIA